MTNPLLNALEALHKENISVQYAMQFYRIVGEDFFTTENSTDINFNNKKIKITVSLHNGLGSKIHFLDRGGALHIKKDINYDNLTPQQAFDLVLPHVRMGV